MENVKLKSKYMAQKKEISPSTPIDSGWSLLKCFAPHVMHTFSNLNEDTPEMFFFNIKLIIMTV